MLHCLFFRSEFTIFGGLEESIRFIANYKFKKEECDALQRLFPHWEAGFLDYLLALDTSQVKVYAIREGTIVFPRIPLLRIEGPLGICQVLCCARSCAIAHISLWFPLIASVDRILNFILENQSHSVICRRALTLSFSPPAPRDDAARAVQLRLAAVHQRRAPPPGRRSEQVAL